jgi:6-pyruvoyl-tetrahydropterin synthase
MESNESKYIMAIIKIPVEIQSNGKTVTHDDKMVMDFENIDKLPENVENKSASNIFNDLFSNHKQIYTKENTQEQPKQQEPKQEEPVNPITNAIQQVFKNQIFVKKEEIQKKQRKSNTTFKNKKSKNQRISQKVYPFNSSSDQDVDLVQSPMGQELQHEDGQ